MQIYGFVYLLIDQMCMMIILLLLLVSQHNIGYLVDSSLFAELQHILEDLQSHKTSSALEWCAKNRSKLKRIDSRLEFNLRCQDLIEMARHAANATTPPSMPVNRGDM